MPAPPRPSIRPREERERIVLDTAARLFYARGVHEVGMDELVRETGLGKATVYRLFPGKDALIGAYLERAARTILSAIDDDVEQHADDPAAAVRVIFAAIGADLDREGFRGCAFNNASVEFPDPDHPARAAARGYRAALHTRLRDLSRRITADGDGLADHLALLVDGMYTSAAHLGAGGPAARGPVLVDALLDAARRR